MIPKRFKIFGTTVNVFIKKGKHTDTDKDSNILGECSHNGSDIMLYTESFYRTLPEDVMKDTFYHEKVHMILDHMNEYELSSNEKFVDVFAKLLRQSEETAEYENE